MPHDILGLSMVRRAKGAKIIVAGNEIPGVDFTNLLSAHENFGRISILEK
jgi:hypothetical protein